MKQTQSYVSVEKAVSSSHVKRSHVICNLSLPDTACTKRGITCRESCEWLLFQNNLLHMSQIYIFRVAKVI